jgi:DnaJ like chaperone protein
MGWLGKAIGAALGLAVAGPFGSVLGALLGHQFDAGIGSRLGGSAATTQGLFFEVTFEVMGHLAKVDGRVSEEEIRVARRIMHAMHLGPEQVQAAISCFTRGKRLDYGMQQRLGELAVRIAGRRDLARAFVEIQMQAAVGGGEIDAGKRRLLWDVSRAFGISRAELAQIEALLRGRGRGGSAVDGGLSLDDAYRSLGVDSGASAAAVKTAYRRLMSQHHPDKLVAKGLPESMISIAEEKTREIRAAYDLIKASRNIR